MDRQDAIQRLEADIEATLGTEYVRAVRVYTRDADEFSGTHGFAQRLVDSVQQHFMDTFVHTTWPPCPQHHKHPLWFEDGFWWCHLHPVTKIPLGQLTADRS